MNARETEMLRVKNPAADRLRGNSGPNRAIRRKCLECSNGLRKEVAECPVVACPLWPFRTGQAARVEG